MEYITIIACGISYNEVQKEMKQKVEDKIHDGWKPQGGISISIEIDSLGFNNLYLAQAMIKND